MEPRADSAKVEAPAHSVRSPFISHALRLKMAQTPSITWSLGPKSLKYES